MLKAKIIHHIQIPPVQYSNLVVELVNQKKKHCHKKIQYNTM
jgi:hypothetical protein